MPTRFIFQAVMIVLQSFDLRVKNYDLRLIRRLFHKKGLPKTGRPLNIQIKKKSEIENPTSEILKKPFAA